MNSRGTEWVARDLATGQSWCLRARDGGWVAPESVSGEAHSGLWLAPGLVDVQVNGYAGVDFQSEALTEEGLLGAARALRRDGCPRFMPTLITGEWKALLAQLARMCRWRAARPELAEAILGWHIEGPFLSAEDGFRGAHAARWMLDPTRERLRALREVAGQDRLLLTLAPERAGAIPGVEQAVGLGIQVSLGHTNASAALLAQAVAAGARGFTHLGNACPQYLDRHDNILWRVLDTAGLRVSVIPDGRHVSPALFRLLHRALAPDSLFYTTDAMAAAGAPAGRYTLGELELEVGADEVVRLPGHSNFAGSALRPIEGIRRAARMLGVSWRTVWPRFSTIPARYVGAPEGWSADRLREVCLVKEGDAGEPELIEP